MLNENLSLRSYLNSNELTTVPSGVFNELTILKSL